MPAPQREDIAKLRHIAAALDIEWPIAMSYPDRIRTLDGSRSMNILREGA